MRSFIAICIIILLTEAKMYELTEFVAPKVMDNWKQLAYCMRYETRDVTAFSEGSQNPKECCMKLFSNWLDTGHDPKTKTYKTLLDYIKKVDDLTAASEEIEEKLIQGRINK